MDDDPWREPDDERWQLPRSWPEYCERWPHDTLLRVVIGFALVFVIAVILAGLGFTR